LKAESSKLTEANKLLAQITEIGARLDDAEAKAQRDLDEVRQRHEGQIGHLKSLFLNKENDLVLLMKKNVAEVFDGKDQVTLERGILLHGKEDKVKIPRDALEKIKAAGWAKEAIKVSESVDRAVRE